MNKKYPITQTIILILVIVTTLTLGSFGMWDYQSLKKRLFQDLLERHDFLVENLEVTLPLPLWSLDMGTIKKIMLGAMQEKQISGIELTIEDQRLILERNKEWKPQFINTTKNISTQDYLVTHKEISLDKINLASISIYSTDIFLNQELTENIYVIIISILLINSFIILILYALMRYYVISPLKYIESYSDKVKNNLQVEDFITSSLEFSNVKDCIQSMVEKLKNRNEELYISRKQQSRLNTDLEKLVKVRTAELEAAMNEAEKASKAKSEFLANMSHEIRTPMNAVVGMCYLAQKTDLSPAQQGYLSKINLSAHSLLDLINDILDLSKVEAGMLNIEHEEFELHNFLEQLSTIIFPKASEKKLEFLIAVASDVPTTLIGDSLRLSQILNNLCNNAVKFTHKGEIIVSISQISDDNPDQGSPIRLRFEVRDTGIGIKQEQMPRLFEAFTQADTSTTRLYGGTGLGLALCKQLTELQGGKIGVSSKWGQGSTFWFELPFNVGTSKEPKVSIPPKLRGLRTLVVDDNPTSLLILQKMLTKIGLEVVVTRSGVSALEILKNYPQSQAFELVIIDWRMPQMDGLELASLIISDKDIFPAPSLVMVSAYANQDLYKKTKELGFIGLLYKPINQSEILNMLIDNFGAQPLSGHSRLSKSYPEPISLQETSILLVEDNEVNRQVVLEILSDTKARLYAAENGQKALDFLEGNNVHLILMDIQMPLMDGYTATQKIREMEKFKETPIIAMTAHAMPSAQKKALAAGMNDHIAKPFNPEELFQMLAKWLLPQPKPAIPSKTEPEHDKLIKQGLDVDMGLRQVRGKTQLYKNLLDQMKDKYATAAKKIQQDIEAGNLIEAMSEAHAIKGAAGMLGAVELSKIAGRLELSLDKGQVDTELLADFKHSLSIVITDISNFKEQQEDLSLSQPERIAGSQDLLFALDKLRPHIVDSFPLECREQSKVLQETWWPEAWRKDVTHILQLTTKYEYSKALIVLDGLVNKIQKIEHV